MEIDALATMPERLVAAALCAALVALVAQRIRALTSSGAAAAVLVGALVVGGGGWWTGAILIVFFVSATALSKLGRSRTSAIRQARGSQRDGVQVLANGGVAAVLAGIALVPSHPEPWIVASSAAIAVATADTWATEIGRISQAAPRGLPRLRHVPVGTSGAISGPGTIGSAFGSMLIALLAAAGVTRGWIPADEPAGVIASIIAIAGLAGSLLDSLLGATLQARYHCDACGEETESPIHACGGKARQTAGVRWINNDVVNALAIAGPALAVLIASIAMD